MACALGAAWVGGFGKYDDYSTALSLSCFPRQIAGQTSLSGDWKEGALWQAIA
jgi:hypothetical protein